MSSSPRVLMPSRRSIEPHVSWASLYEFEDAIVAIDDVELAVVETIEPTPSRFTEKVLSKVSNATGISIERKPRRREITVDQDYDLFFACIMGPNFFDHIPAMNGWQNKCRIKTCWVVELWDQFLEYEDWLEPLRAFDHIFVGSLHAVPTLSKILDRPCSYLPFATDTFRFCPYPDPPARSVDFYLMGRRSPITHQSLLDHARARQDFMYLYDSTGPGFFANGHADHRELLANLVKRSRYFGADRSAANRPGLIRDKQVFGPRFFEGAAGGAMLVGEPPDCRVFDECFDWPDAVIPVPHGSDRIPELIAELDADPDRIDRARRANVVNTLRRHDWLHRWQTVLETVGLEPTVAATERAATLERRAAMIETERQRRD